MHVYQISLIILNIIYMIIIYAFGKYLILIGILNGLLMKLLIMNQNDSNYLD